MVVKILSCCYERSLFQGEFPVFADQMAVIDFNDGYPGAAGLVEIGKSDFKDSFAVDCFFGDDFKRFEFFKRGFGGLIFGEALHHGHKLFAVFGGNF